jgi:hypothetical protein
MSAAQHRSHPYLTARNCQVLEPGDTGLDEGIDNVVNPGL